MAERSKQEQAVQAVLDNQAGYAGTQAWLEAILARLPAGEPLQDATLALLEQRLRGGYGSEYLQINDEYNAHIAFWGALAQRFPSRPRLRGLQADTLLLAGQVDAALDQFLEAFQQEPTLVYTFGGELYDFFKEKGGEAWLEYQLTLVRAALQNDDAEYAKIVYRRLLEEYRGDPQALKKIHRLAGEML